MTLLLNVPAADTNQAESAGAVYHEDTSKWLLPDAAYGRLHEVQQWLAPEGYIVLSDNILIAESRAVCSHCGHTNLVIAIGSDFFFERDINERDEEVWVEQDFFALFHCLTYISDNLVGLLRDSYPHYRPAPPEEGKVYWYNHCTQCQQPMDDHRLMDVPGQTFHPRNSEEAATITLRTFQSKYAPLLDADYEVSQHPKLIAEFAARI
ncbi:hypothetical protein [Chitinophaga sp. sic0106]|uniref:hypothetical protein n=1 Tax=Chitinophaga sp. sic0106 TaxID=2854785 RepID=UPI001C448204|nr:hypothetical protein [Chitinophaga sp. sic0106]MBV7532975.1 hypothetical protein [Chitinophaga sp. sic0106]